MEYTTPSFRKTKGDKKAKRSYNKYKRGGKNRSKIGRASCRERV